MRSAKPILGIVRGYTRKDPGASKRLADPGHEPGLGLLATRGLVDDAIDFQTQRPRQRFGLLLRLFLGADVDDRGSPNYLAGIVTLRNGRHQTIAAVFDLQTN